jgi:hypothetical protein
LSSEKYSCLTPNSRHEWSQAIRAASQQWEPAIQLTANVWMARSRFSFGGGRIHYSRSGPSANALQIDEGRAYGQIFGARRSRLVALPNKISAQGLHLRVGRKRVSQKSE